MTASDGPAGRSAGLTPARLARAVVVSSVMFVFISSWRAAAVVLCDLASTAYYIGGIVEQSVGPAAPWFILAVMLFSGAVAALYVESSAVFVRGGVYRVVKEAMGGFPAKLSVSALMFDYVLTGPISGVAAGQYLVGLGLALYAQMTGTPPDDAAKAAWKGWGSVAVACLITLYFFRQNLLGIRESSGKALKIMVAMAVMAAVVGGWSAVTLAVEGPRNAVPLEPNLAPKPNPTTGEMESPLGFLQGTALAERLAALHGADWLSLVGLVGLVIAFGHSILAMSGLETMAQVYREVEAPKLRNFKRVAVIVFAFSTLVTAGISFLAVLLIPNEVRMAEYADNLIGGLAMNVTGPTAARLLLTAFVVVVGFLILAGAVNTAIIGSNGVLNRVAEDGVLPDWLLKPHPRYGTTHRVLYLIVGLQLFTILASRGDVLLLGEAYAFGVVWSFVFKALAMLVLRFRDRRPRPYKVPLNLRVGRVELPVGLGLIFLALLAAAVANLLTKPTATTWGLGFTAAFLAVFSVSEFYHVRRRRGARHEHLEQFNREAADEVTADGLGLTKPYRKLVAIRSPQNLVMLEKTLAGTDPETTDVVVMTAKTAADEADDPSAALGEYERRLMTAVVERAEAVGKRVVPLVVPTNNPLYAVLRTARQIGAQELVLGASNRFTAGEQLDQVGLYWAGLHPGRPPGLTVRILGPDRDLTHDLHGGNRIPTVGERLARSLADLRAAGVGVGRVLLAHDGTAAGSDLFRSVLTMLDPQVTLDVVAVPTADGSPAAAGIDRDCDRASRLGREVRVHAAQGDPGREIVRLAREGVYDLVFLPLPGERGLPGPGYADYVLRNTPCQVCLTAPPSVPMEVAG